MQIYIHIPFCVKKCLYCDFLSGPQNQATIEKYVDGLRKEIEAYGRGKNKVTSVFIGGGTPSILTACQIEKIFRTLNEFHPIDVNAEITIEANPGTVTREKLIVYKKCGINRISFGLQSANDAELKILGRIHTYDTFVESFQMARDCGFENINVDLMSAIPNQTLQSFEETLHKVIKLQPEHISAYSLIVEEGTPYAKLYGEGGPKKQELPTEEVEREIYYKTEEILGQAGYHRYEISNYAKPGMECRHNVGYWDRKEYIGFGLGAAGLINETRLRNTDDLEYYIANASNTEKIKVETEILPETAQMEEYMFLGMRKTEGVSISRFAVLFGNSMEHYYGNQIKKLEKAGLIQRKGDCMMLTKRGIDVSNYVLSEFIQ